MIASRGESWGMLCVGQHYAAFCVPEEYRERQIKEVSKRGLAALKFPQNWWGRAREVGIKQHKNPPCRKESNGTQAWKLGQDMRYASAEIKGSCFEPKIGRSDVVKSSKVSNLNGRKVWSIISK